MSDPRVSIIIPVWNHAPEALALLASLESQTFRAFEVILVDDGSTDGLVFKLAGVKPSFPFTFIQQENHGASAARNRGAQEAKGEYLLFLDADIAMESNALDLMVRELNAHAGQAFIYSSFYFGWKLFQGKPFDQDALKKMNYIHTSSLLRRSMFPGFDASLIKFQDWDLWLTIAEHGGSGYWIEKPLFRIKTRKTGISQWMPSFLYRIPWPIFGWMPRAIKRYREAETIIRKKHHL
ncbi:MAG: glycosyltransferase family A protein [bacterium]|nr:glycosyltransferase family A protein [bacterium]